MRISENADSIYLQDNPAGDTEVGGGGGEPSDKGEQRQITTHGNNELRWQYNNTYERQR